MNHKEYVAPSGETVTFDKAKLRDQWQVGCWDEEGNNRWLLTFSELDKAEAEYERWRK